MRSLENLLFGTKNASEESEALRNFWAKDFSYCESVFLALSQNKMVNRIRIMPAIIDGNNQKFRHCVMVAESNS